MEEQEKIQELDAMQEAIKKINDATSTMAGPNMQACMRTLNKAWEGLKEHLHPSPEVKAIPLQKFVIHVCAIRTTR